MKLVNAVEIILYKTYTNVCAETARSYLGVLWWVIEPVLYLGAFYVLFVLVLKRDDPAFIPSFLCGTVIWKWFSGGVVGGGNAITANRKLIQQVYVSKMIFPVMAVIDSTVRFVPVFGIFVFFLLCYGVPCKITWLSIFILMLFQFLLTLAIASFISVVMPFLPDLSVPINNGMMLLFFLSGVFFDINDVSEPLRSVLLLNPMAGLIYEYRRAMFIGEWPDPWCLLYVAACTLVLGLLASGLYKHVKHQYGKMRF